MVFSIGAATAAALIPADAGSGEWLIWLARIGVDLGLLVGAGGAFFGSWIGLVHAGSNAIRTALVMGLFCAAASIGPSGPRCAGSSASGYRDSRRWWKVGFATSLGPSLLIAVAAMVVALVAQRSPSGRVARALSMIAIAGVGLSLGIERSMLPPCCRNG